MAQMVIMLVLAGLILVVAVLAETELRELRVELKRLRERLDCLERKNRDNPSASPPTSITPAAQVLNSTVVRAWWLGEQGWKRVQEKEEE